MTYKEFCKGHRVYRGEKQIKKALLEIGVDDIAPIMHRLHTYPGGGWIVEETPNDCGSLINGSYESGSLEQVELMLFRSITSLAAGE